MAARLVRMRDGSEAGRCMMADVSSPKHDRSRRAKTVGRRRPAAHLTVGPGRSHRVALMGLVTCEQFVHSWWLHASKIGPPRTISFHPGNAFLDPADAGLR